MRELTLPDTGYLAGLLLLSLVLPLLMSFRGPRNLRNRNACIKTVWIGQALVAVAAVAVLTSAFLAPYATAAAVMSYSGCTFVLLRRFYANA